MDIDHGEILDIVLKSLCVDSQCSAWKEKRQAEWERQDANWEKEYDARIEKEAREKKEREAQEEERWALLSEEEKRLKWKNLKKRILCY